MLSDAVAIVLAGILAVFLRFEFHLPAHYVQRYLWLAILEVPLRLVIYSFFGLYNRLWKYASVRELIAVVLAASLGSALVLVAVHVEPFAGFPRSIVVLSWLINIFCVGGIRFAVRLRQEFHAARMEPNGRQSSGETRLLIIGAGAGGAMILREILRGSDEGYRVMGFVDDDPHKTGFRISGVPVLGTTSDIERLVEERRVDHIVIAIPSLSRQGMRSLVNTCKRLRVRLKTLPRIVDLVNGQISIRSIRDVQLEDLLGRDEIKVDLESISGYLKDQVVLVTGAGGSIGSELCRQICRFSPRQLFLFGGGNSSGLRRAELPGLGRWIVPAMKGSETTD